MWSRIIYTTLLVVVIVVGATAYSYFKTSMHEDYSLIIAFGVGIIIGAVSYYIMKGLKKLKKNDSN